VPLIQEERVREIEFGIMDGLTKKGIRERYPLEAKRRQTLGKYWYRPPGGESWPDVALRLHSFLGALNRDCRGESVLVVCHSVVVLLFRRLLERLSETEILAIDSAEDVANCSITHYAFDANVGVIGKLVLRKFNLVVYDRQMVTAEPPRTETV
jgi:broad specificity phosphatase PhoE